MAVSGVADLVGRVLAGRYRLVASIGTGASGRVYVAEDVRLRRRVAVKVLHAALVDDAGFLRRFRAEARLAASLHHPNVVTVYDWGDDGLPFMVLELLEGGSLRGLLDRDRRLSPAQTAHVGRQVAAALEYAHVRGLVHRDIKPANLLFDEHGIVRVADFGLARALAEASWTEPAGTVTGTARYAAPEQATGERLDGRADLYALALVLVEAVTGRVPFVADTTIGTLVARTQRPIPAPAELGPLAPVVERAGRPDPADRYPDATTMGEALATAAASLPPPGPLVLAGLSDAPVDDPHPTALTRTGEPVVFDQDAEIRVIPEPAVHRRRRWPGGRAVAPIVVGLVVALTLGVAALALTRGPDGSVPVPNVIGLDREAAIAQLADAGLGVEVDERESTDPPGVVIDQSPAPGRRASEDGSVQLVVSRGPPPVAVPDVGGLGAEEAGSALTGAGFVVVRDDRFDEQVDRGVVVGTEPAAGGLAPPESSVTLVVSAGPAPVEVPDVSGVTYEEAAAALAAKRFQTAPGEQFSDTVPVGAVVGTDPPAGERAPRDSTVTVLVSRGPELVDVPNLVNDTVESASARLATLGLTADPEGAFAPGRRVRAQDPPAGTRVAKGSSVTLFL